MTADAAPDSGSTIGLRGLSGSPGVGVGAAIVIGRTATPFKRRKVPDFEVDVEVNRFRAAVADGGAQLRKLISKAGRAGGELAILDAYALMLADPILSEEVERKIRLDRKCSEWAVATTIREFSSQFERAEDLYLRERSHDLEFVGEMLVRVLRGALDVRPLVKLEQPGIVVAHDLSPADTAALANEPVLGIITERGTRTGHTAIMARALEIPAVVGVNDALLYANPGDEIIVDGFRAEVLVRPSDLQTQRAKRRAQQHRSRKDQLRGAVDQPVVMACGTPIAIRANIELPEEAPMAVGRGAQGIGLYRTEFMYINRSSPPTEQEQYETYRALVQAVSPQPVTLRTFDIGGDKFASSLALPPEPNPALGLRAIRLGLAYPQTLRNQLCAMVRASVHGPIRIMLPMVATLVELREIKKMLDSVIEDLDRRDVDHAKHIPLGVMLEVPSSLVMADHFAQEADFMSLGTNDLTQYTLAADRTNRALAYLSNPFDPAMLRLIHGATHAAYKHTTPLSVCGEMASDPLGALMLVGLGINELSMEGASVPEIKECLRRVHHQEAQTVALKGLELDTAEHVEQHVAQAFAPRLVDLLETDPDK